MRISAISDVHIKTPHDAADELLFHFLTHPLVQESDYVLLLGDIFDLMCGPHRQYLEDYQHLFHGIDRLIKNGKKIFYIEGNHDVHLERLFDLFWKNGEVRPTRRPVISEIEGKTYYFSHGDEHDLNNDTYHRYMKFILSPPLKFVADHVMPYSMLNFLGERASKMSRKKGGRHFDEEKVRQKFRGNLELSILDKGYDFVIGGHSHVKDNYLLSNQRTRYVNNGYALNSKTFITINDHEVCFVDI